MAILIPIFLSIDHFLYRSPTFYKKWKTKSMYWKFEIFALRSIDFLWTTALNPSLRLQVLSEEWHISNYQQNKATYTNCD